MRSFRRLVGAGDAGGIDWRNAQVTPIAANQQHVRAANNAHLTPGPQYQKSFWELFTLLPTPQIAAVTAAYGMSQKRMNRRLNEMRLMLSILTGAAANGERSAFRTSINV